MSLRNTGQRPQFRTSRRHTTSWDARQLSVVDGDKTRLNVYVAPDITAVDLEKLVAALSYLTLQGTGNNLPASALKVFINRPKNARSERTPLIAFEDLAQGNFALMEKPNDPIE